MKTLIIGDSHARFFNINEDLRMLDNIYKGVNNHVLSLSGATINGFGRRESTLNTQQKVVEEYQRLNPDYLCFALGQVDIELGFYYKKLVKGENIDFRSYAQKTTDNYVSSIIETSKNLDHPIEKTCVKGVNLSVLVYNRAKAVKYTARIITENISNKEEVEKLTNKFKNLMPSALEINHNHNYFNNLLRKKATAHNIRYFDINDKITDGKTGLVDKNYVPAEFDHHLVNSLAIREWHVSRLLETVLDPNV